MGSDSELNPPVVTTATTRSSAKWYSAIFCAAFLTIICASAAVSKTGAEAMTAAEKWVVAQATAGEIADLTKQFPEEKDRKLRADFLEELLMGALPAFKPHRNGAQISGAIIDEPIELTNARIPCDVRLEHCQFMSRATLSRASFTGLVSFDGSEFKEDAIFRGMKVGGDAIFKAAVFQGQVDFTGAEIVGDFTVKKALFQGKDNQAKFQSMKVAGLAIFDGARFEGQVDVYFADFGSLDLSNASLPKVEGLSQLHYKYISAGHGADSHKALLTLAKSLPYNGSWYSRLEDFFLREGYRAEADKAFIEGKRQERKQWERSGRWLLCLGSLMLDLLVGYGRRPWQAAIPCAVLIALGCVLFSPKKMEPRNPQEAPRAYSRFWYSVGLFLPFVDLQADKVWRPKADQTFLRNYMPVHILLGWILIPIALAALTGLIK